MPVPADHSGVDVVAGESPFAGDTFGVRGGEFVVREDQVAATALDVESKTDPAQGDRRALDVPARSPRAERGGPTGLTRTLGTPEQRVECLGLAGTIGITATLGEQPQHGGVVVVRFVAELRRHVSAEVHIGMIGVVDGVGGARGEQFLDHLDHFVDGLGRGDVVARRKDPQCGHVLAEQPGLPRTEIAPVHTVAFGPFEQRIVDVGDVLHVVHPVTVVQPHALRQVEGEIRRRMAQMGGVVGGDAADVHGRGPTGSGGANLPVGAVVEPKLRPPAGQPGDLDTGPGPHQLTAHIASSSTPAISGRHISRSGR